MAVTVEVTAIPIVGIISIVLGTVTGIEVAIAMKRLVTATITIPMRMIASTGEQEEYA